MDDAASISAAELEARGLMPLAEDGVPWVVVARPHGAPVALAGRCPHAGAPLSGGRLDGDCLVCPWHQARFRLADGRPVAGPTLLPLARRSCRVEGGRVRLGPPLPPRRPPAAPGRPGRVLLVGLGPASLAAAAALREHGHRGAIVAVGDEAPGFVERTRLSKVVPPRELAWPGIGLGHGGLDIELWAGHRVAGIDAGARSAEVEGPGGRAQLSFDACMLAPGARVREGQLPGDTLAHVHTLRGLGDAQRLAAGVPVAGEVTVVGGSFIALEVAAQLASRGARPRLLLPQTLPWERLLGARLASWWLGHQRRGGVAELPPGRLRAIAPFALELADGRRVPTRGPVVLGLGVVPDVRLAAAAGLAVDDGIRVDPQMRTSRPGIWAAGDVAHVDGGRWSGRIEHWSWAMAMGRQAALSMLELPPRDMPVPFFWTRQFGRTLSVVGRLVVQDGPAHATLVGDLEGGQVAAALRQGGALRAVAAVGLGGLSVACGADLAARAPWRAEARLAAMRPA